MGLVLNCFKTIHVEKKPIVSSCFEIPNFKNKKNQIIRRTKFKIRNLKRKLKDEIVINKQYKNDEDLLEESYSSKPTIIQRQGIYRKIYNHEF